MRRTDLTLSLAALALASSPAVGGDEPADVTAVYVVSGSGEADDVVSRYAADLAHVDRVRLPGRDAYGGAAPGSDLVLVVERPSRPAEGWKPRLLRVDAKTLAVSEIDALDPTLHWGFKLRRPTDPFLTGPDVAGVIAAPLQRVNADREHIHDVKLRVVDLASGGLHTVTAPHDTAFGVLYAMAGGSRRALVVTELERELRDVDLATGETRAAAKEPLLPGPPSGESPPGLRGFVARPSAGSFTVMDSRGNVAHVDLKDRTVRKDRLPVEGIGETAFPTSLAHSPAAKLCAVTIQRAASSDGEPHAVALLDEHLEKVVSEIEFPAAVDQVAFSPRGTEIVALLGDGSLGRWRVSDGKELARVTDAQPVGRGSAAILAVR